MFYAEPITDTQPDMQTYATRREKTVCPRRDLNPGQSISTVLVTGTNRCSTEKWVRWQVCSWKMVVRAVFLSEHTTKQIPRVSKERTTIYFLYFSC